MIVLVSLNSKRLILSKRTLQCDKSDKIGTKQNSSRIKKSRQVNSKNLG